jgi:type VI secretion system protein ImpH
VGAAVGRETDAVALLASLAETPYRHDFYQTLRRLECLYDAKPRWGQARRPADEPLRLGQEPDLAFAPAALASFETGRDGAPHRLQVHLFGLLGPNGPLPIHITEYARERLRHAGDATLSRFLDLLHHRFLSLFYRAWAQAQPHVNRDRPKDDRFMVYIGAFAGLAPAAFRDRDTVPDLAKLFHVAALLRQARNADGLHAILAHFFGVPVQIEQFVGHWMPLGRRERTCLAREGATLGGGAVLGRRVWDRQHKFRIHLGPLTFEQYEAFLPGGAKIQQLVDWVRMYLDCELEWDVRVSLGRSDIPPMRLGRGRRLGWTSWLGGRSVNQDAEDLCLNAEAFAGSRGVAAI